MFCSYIAYLPYLHYQDFLMWSRNVGDKYVKGLKGLKCWKG